MRIAVFAFSLTCILGCCGCAHTNAGPKARSTSSAETSATRSETVANSSAEMTPTNSFAKPATASATAPAKVDFPTQIRPLLEAKCHPCHFNGGKVYQRMPFDRPETIKTLGTKLFTRIKDENERRLIRDFLAQE